MNYCCSLCPRFPSLKWHNLCLNCAANINMAKNVCGNTRAIEVLWTGKILGQILLAAWPWGWCIFPWWGQTLQGEGRMSAACAIVTRLVSPSFLPLSDLLLSLGSKGWDVSWSKNLSEMTQMRSWALPTCCSPNVLAGLILPYMSSAAGRRRRGPSSPHLSLCRSQTGLGRVAAALTRAKATWEPHSLDQAPWMGWPRGYGFTPKPNDLEEHGLSALSQPWSYGS